MRFGLAAVPLVLFLAGGVQTYLTPDLYRSTCVMEYLGPRQLAEAAALLKSRPVISLAADRLDLVKKLAVDRDTAEEILRKRIVSSVEPGTGFIRLAVEGTQRQQVRDFAQALPEALGSYEKSRALAGLASRLEATRKSTRVLEDVQEEKRKKLATLLRSRGGEADDALSKMEFDDARGIWVHARMKALESADAAAAVESEITAIGNPVVIISPAAVSSKPVGQEGGLHLGDVIFQALVSGLAFALGAPYLLELAFPRRLRRKRPEVETWAEEIDHSGFAEWPANG